MIIPKILHRIWLGSAPLPSYAVEYGQTWQDNHPDWELRLWTDEEVARLSLHNRHLLNRPDMHAAAKSDVLRYELIYQFGGLYVDTDIECFKNTEPLIGELEQFASYQTPGYLCNAVLGGTKNNRFFQKLVLGLDDSFRTNSGILDTAGPGYLTRNVLAEDEFTKLDPKYFYPFLWTEQNLGRDNYPEAYGAHHWVGSWFK